MGRDDAEQGAALPPEADAVPSVAKAGFPDHPAPPRRPADLVAYADVPLPPTRPSGLPAIASLSLLPSGASAYARVDQPGARRDPIGALLGGSRRDGGDRAAIVPARLDHSNFRAMTTGTPAARMTSQAVSGPTLVAPRSAARAEKALLSPKPAGTLKGFSDDATELPTGTFGAHRPKRASASVQ